MVKPSEDDIREMLEHRASAFDIAPAPSDGTLRKARRRKVRNVVLMSAGTITVVVLAGLSVTLQPGADRASDSEPATGGQLRLVDYAIRAPAPEHEDSHPTTGPEITLGELNRHQKCMRAQGFDLPKPTRQPGGRWSVILHPARARHLSFRSREFRQAWFVTCGPLGGPLSGDLIVGGPRLKIDRFMSCMSGAGFNLPDPKKDTSGHYDNDAWQFDLTRTSVDTSTPAWNQAMFVTCAPDDI
jgi:hypothetical protein